MSTVKVRNAEYLTDIQLIVMKIEPDFTPIKHGHDQHHDHCAAGS